jgi:thiol:disulfide interchange protein
VRPPPPPDRARFGWLLALLTAVIGAAFASALPAFAQEAAVAPATPPADAPAEVGLLPFALTGFGAGLLALLTPCVFPMIPVTLSFFTKQATETGTSVLKLAAAYCLGIIVTFTGLGALMAILVGPAGAARLAANPWVNLFFAGVFVFFGLALLEVIDLTLPPAIQKIVNGGRTDDPNKKKNPIPTVLFMGLTFVIVAFTCTAPFIGTVLVAAAAAGSAAAWVRPIIGMLAFASALALPFFVLALFPGLLAKLPKSGSWMTTFKGTMGFIELGAALKFLSNADLVWQWQIVTRPVILALWVALSFAAVAWLFGKLDLGFSTPSGKMTVGRGIGAGLFAAFGVYCLVGLTGRPLPGLEGGFLPLPDYGYKANGGAVAAKPEGAVKAEGPRKFKNDIAGAIAEAERQKRLIFVDFTGYT